MYGGYGVGGAIAGGIQSGFEMGRQLDLDQERREQRAFENNRQTALDTQRTQQIERSNRREDESDALAANTAEAGAHTNLIAGLAQQYGGIANIPADVAQHLTARSNELYQQRQTLLQSRMNPVIQREQQWADDTSSRLATGQLKWEQLSNADKVRLIETKTKRPIGDFLRPADGSNSKIGQGIADSTAGVQTGNHGLIAQGASTLLEPELNQGLGAVAPDGSQIVSKRIAGFVPAAAPPQAVAAAASPPPTVQGATDALNAATGVAAGMADTPAPNLSGGQPPAAVPQGVPPQTPAQPQALSTSPPPPPPAPLAPGQDPDLVHPVLQVTTRHADGTEGSYHAPVTADRTATTDGAPLAPPTSVSDMMNHMGQLGTLEAFVNQPGVRADLEDGLKARGGNSGTDSLLGAYYALHGKPGDLQSPNYQGAPGQRILAAKQLMTENPGMTMDEALTKVDSKLGQMQERINHVLALYPGTDPASVQQRNTLIRDIVLGAGGKTTGLIQKPLDVNAAPLTADAIDQLAHAALKDRSSLVGLGRDPNKISQVLNRMAEISGGGDLAASRALYTADKKSLDKMIPQYDAITSFENNALAQGQRLVDLAKKVDTTGVPVIERWIRAGRKSVAGDADVTAFNTQLGIFAPEVAKILTNPNLTGVLTDRSQEEVRKFLPDNLTAGQADRVVRLLSQDFATRHASIEGQVQEIVDRMAKRGTQAGEKPGARAAATAATGAAPSTPPMANGRDLGNAGDVESQRRVLTQEANDPELSARDRQVAQQQLDALPPPKAGVAGALGTPKPKEPVPQQGLPGAKPPGGAAPASAPAAQPVTATGPGGKKLQLVNGQWVPLQ